MNETAFDPQLQALLNLPVRLNPNAKTCLQQFRGENWYLVYDPITSHQLLLDEPTWHFLDRLLSAPDLRTAMATPDSPPADEVFSFVSRLIQADLVVIDSPTVGRPASQGQALLKRLATPFAIRIPLVDPDSFLAWLAMRSGVLFSPLGIGLLLILLVTAVGILTSQWTALAWHWESRFLDPANLATLVLLYPLVKGLHEIGHGLTARRWGAEIHELGVMLLVFLPVPYVDASATAAFPDSRKRMSVAAAGIVTELILSSLALIGWRYLEPGLVRDLCFNIAVIGGVSTLLFNGNPLLRFDGYYVLGDALEIPNLGSRASQLLGYHFRRHLLGLPARRPRTQSGETGWLVSYGLLSGLYRLSVTIAIAAYIATRFFVFGILLAAYLLAMQIVRPLVRGSLATLALMKDEARYARPLVVFTLLLVVLPLLIFAVPMGHTTTAWGIILPPESSIVRVETPGFVASTPPNNGQRISADENLLSLRNDDLEFLMLEKEAQLRQVQAEHRAALLNSPADVNRLTEAVALAESEFLEVTARFEALQIRATRQGVFSSMLATEPQGRYLERGSVIGVVTEPGQRTAQVMVPQHQLHLVDGDTREINITTLDQPGRRLSASVAAGTPQAVEVLPDRSLGTASGGPIPVDASDDQGTRLLEPMFKINLLLRDKDLRIGQTVLVRFSHHKSPLSARIATWLHNQINLLLN